MNAGMLGWQNLRLCIACFWKVLTSPTLHTAAAEIADQLTVRVELAVKRTCLPDRLSVGSSMYACGAVQQSMTSWPSAALHVIEHSHQ